MNISNESMFDNPERDRELKAMIEEAQDKIDQKLIGRERVKALKKKRYQE